MRTYSDKIALVKNSRGIYGLDTSMGCASGMKNPGGCYGDCYAAKSAKTYGYDFSKTVLRHFTDRQHERRVVSQISKIKLDFVRIGCSGDPSEDWEHCLNILRVIRRGNKQVVIITKHWTLLTDEQLLEMSRMNICINTSVSALDNPDQLVRNILEYERIKPYCKSVLRIVSCNFNRGHKEGERLAKIQEYLFKHEDTIDTVFRPSKKNPLVVDSVIKVDTGRFNGHMALMSKYNKKTYTGKCANCQEMCGAAMVNEKYSYPDKKPVTKQLKAFRK